MNSKESIKPDIVMKEFWRVNERFADLFNAVLFNGKNVIKSDMLKEMDTDISGTIKWKKGQSSLKRVRDIVKKEYDGVEFNILGIEIQDKVHYAMTSSYNNNCAILFRDAVGRSCQYKRYDDTYETRNRKYIYRL